MTNGGFGDLMYHAKKDQTSHSTCKQSQADEFVLQLVATFGDIKNSWEIYQGSSRLSSSYTWIMTPKESGIRKSIFRSTKPPKFNIALENDGWNDYFPFGMV